MKILELVARLQAHPNQEADINFYLNVVNGDLEEYDEEATLEIFNEDAFYEDFIDIHIAPKIIKDKTDIENSIHLFLAEDEYNLDVIKIEIDVNNGIYILSETDGVLRECEFSNPHSMSREERVKDTVLKLRKML